MYLTFTKNRILEGRSEWHITVLSSTVTHTKKSTSEIYTWRILLWRHQTHQWTNLYFTLLGRIFNENNKLASVSLYLFESTFNNNYLKIKKGVNNH